MVQPAQLISHMFVPGLHDWPAAQVDVPGRQRSEVSSHDSVPLQVTVSAHARAAPGTHAPAAQLSPLVQYAPSSQVPVRFDLAVVDVAGVHTRHCDVGFVVPAA